MTINVPAPLIFFFAAFVVVYAISLTFSSQKTGGGYFPASSDRDAFWFVGLPVLATVWLFMTAIYYYGIVKGWWQS